MTATVWFLGWLSSYYRLFSQTWLDSRLGFCDRSVFERLSFQCSFTTSYCLRFNSGGFLTSLSQSKKIDFVLTEGWSCDKKCSIKCIHVSSPSFKIVVRVHTILLWTQHAIQHVRQRLLFLSLSVKVFLFHVTPVMLSHITHYWSLTVKVEQPWYFFCQHCVFSLFYCQDNETFM